MDYEVTSMYTYMCLESNPFGCCCDQRNCVLHYFNGNGADQALEEKLGNSGLTKKELCKRVSKLSCDEYINLIEEYRRKEGMQNYCK